MTVVCTLCRVCGIVVAREEKRVFSEIHGGHPVKEKRVFEKFFQKFMEGQGTPCHPSSRSPSKRKEFLKSFFRESHRRGSAPAPGPPAPLPPVIHRNEKNFFKTLSRITRWGKRTEPPRAKNTGLKSEGHSHGQETRLKLV